MLKLYDLLDTEIYLIMKEKYPLAVKIIFYFQVG